MNRKTRSKILIILGILLCMVISSPLSLAPSSPTHTLDTSIYHFLLDNGSRLKFDADTISLGDSSGLWTWIDSNGIQFYNLRMDGDSSSVWSIRVEDANVTINSLFKDNKLDFTVSAPSWVVSTTHVYCGDYGKPMYVSGASTWSYNYATNMLTVNILHLSEQQIELEWVFPKGFTTTIHNNFYLAFGLISLIPVVVASMIIVGVIKGRENLDMTAIFGLTIFFVALILGFIILWNIMTALI